jgi:flagellar motility protein MotE (MotC chaperone)
MAKIATKPPGKTTPKVKPAPRRRRARRGTLMLIAGLLVTSAILRVGTQTGTVLALEKLTGDHPVEEMTAHEDAPQTAEMAAPPDIEAMLGAFKAREARLDQREMQIRDRMNALAIADEEIEKKLAQLEAAEAALKQTLALADSAAENDLSRLTAVYENMKPKDSAALFEQMDPDFAAGFLGRMQPAAAAALMAGLTPERAYTISVVLAGRNSSVPKK